MKLLLNIHLADTERALLYEHQRLVNVLEPGWHRLLNVDGRYRIERYDVTEPFNHPKARFLIQRYAGLLGPHMQIEDIGDRQVGLVYREQTLVGVLAPGTLSIRWLAGDQLRTERVDISTQPAISAAILDTLVHSRKPELADVLRYAVYHTEVPDQHVGLLFVNGARVALLNTGDYGFWQYNRNVKVALLDLRLQSLEVSGQEILTKDRVSLRINLTANYRIADVEQALRHLKDIDGFVYRELQLELREAVGTQSLDGLLEDKDALNLVVFQNAKQRLADYGIEVKSVGVKDIILPGDMKEILNKVVEAQKAAEANLIRRREETQAMRSLHNTAKMMENNPTLLRLKELESLERVTERIDRISVYGGLDAVLNDLVTLAPRAN